MAYRVYASGFERLRQSVNGHGSHAEIVPFIDRLLTETFLFPPAQDEENHNACKNDNHGNKNRDKQV